MGLPERILRRGRNLWADRVARKRGCVDFVLASGMTKEQAWAWEVSMIARCRASGANLANQTAGGPGFRRKHSKRAREKISSVQLGKVQTPESNALRSAALKGIPRPWVSTAMKGVPKSAEHIRKVVEANSRPEAKARQIAGASKPKSEDHKRKLKARQERLRALAVKFGIRPGLGFRNVLDHPDYGKESPCE
jgi:hypothetical protein